MLPREQNAEPIFLRHDNRVHHSRRYDVHSHAAVFHALCAADKRYCGHNADGADNRAVVLRRGRRADNTCDRSADDGLVHNSAACCAAAGGQFGVPARGRRGCGPFGNMGDDSGNTRRRAFRHSGGNTVRAGDGGAVYARIRMGEPPRGAEALCARHAG